MGIISNGHSFTSSPINTHVTYHIKGSVILHITLYYVLHILLWYPNSDGSCYWNYLLIFIVLLTWSSECSGSLPPPPWKIMSDLTVCSKCVQRSIRRATSCWPCWIRFWESTKSILRIRTLASRCQSLILLSGKTF